jgi:hypothetical protein
MVSAPIGYKCKDCGQRNISHLEKISLKQYILGSTVGLITGIGAGYIWNQLSVFGIFISILVAYAVGFCVSRAISKVIGNKIGLKIQVLAGLIVVIGMLYNPVIIFGSGLIGSYSLPSAIISFTFNGLFNIVSFLSIVIAVWAAIRHFKF